MTTLYQLQLDHSLVNCGMSYVFHLDNGQFFLLDGGYFTPGEEARLYAFLENLAKGPPHIAGWFFSHAHQDHIGNFINFIRRYKDSLQLDGLYYNFQPMDFSGVTGDWRSSDPATFREFYIALEECCGHVPQHILQTGQRIPLGELTLEVIYTREDITPQHQNPRFNDFSTVIRIHVQDQKILFLGDVHQVASKILLENPEYLAADIVQISHHGYAGASQALYEAIPAKVALWPTPAYAMAQLPERPVNEYLLKNSPIEEHLFSGLGTAQLIFPYAPGQAILHQDPALTQQKPPEKK